MSHQYRKVSDCNCCCFFPISSHFVVPLTERAVRSTKFYLQTIRGCELPIPGSWSYGTEEVSRHSQPMLSSVMIRGFLIWALIETEFSIA
jgi:hypothetical protein